MALEIETGLASSWLAELLEDDWPRTLRFTSVSRCFMIFASSDTSTKSRVAWILFFFLTGFYATEIYFVVRSITGWKSSKAVPNRG